MHDTSGKLWILILALGVLGWSCRTPGNDARTRDRDLVEAEVMTALRAFEAAERTRSPEAVIAFLDRSFTMLADGKRYDYAETTAQMRATLPNLRAFEPRFEDVRLLPLARDAALTSMVFHDVMTDAEGVTSAVWGPSTIVWRKRGDAWRIVFADSDHYAVEPPGEDRRRTP